MLDLLISIDRRAKYLDSALPKIPAKTAEPMISFALPGEPWAEQFKGLDVPAIAMANLSRHYGEEAAVRGESPVVTMLRNAASGETPRLDAEIEIELMRLPDCGAVVVEQILHDWNTARCP